MQFSIGSSSAPKLCDGCGSILPATGTMLCVGAQLFHSRDCYDRTRPALDVYRDRCAEVTDLERQLAFAKAQCDAAEQAYLNRDKPK